MRFKNSEYCSLSHTTMKDNIALPNNSGSSSIGLMLAPAASAPCAFSITVGLWRDDTAE